MLSIEENERITRTGPGTPMGALFRRFWMPICTADRLPEPGCAPAEVIVQVATCGVCGTDRAIFRGEAPAAWPVVLAHLDHCLSEDS